MSLIPAFVKLYALVFKRKKKPRKRLFFYFITPFHKLESKKSFYTTHGTEPGVLAGAKERYKAREFHIWLVNNNSFVQVFYLCT